MGAGVFQICPKYRFKNLHPDIKAAWRLYNRLNVGWVHLNAEEFSNLPQRHIDLISVFDSERAKIRDEESD